MKKSAEQQHVKYDSAEGRKLKGFAAFSVLLLFLAAVLGGNPEGIPEGMRQIVISRDALITDYFELAGQNAALLNSALVMGGCTALLLVLKVPFTGLTMAVLFINAGFALWGKSPLNMIPVIVGTALYSKVHSTPFSHYIYTGLFGTCLSPFVTEMVHLLPFSFPVNVLLAVLTGIFIGFVLPPLSMHTASMHMGYSLYNIGFAAGILAFVMVCVLRAMGFHSSSVLLWQEGRSISIAVGLYLYFGAAFLYGLLLSGNKLRRLWGLLRHPGRAVTDFVLMDGIGPTLMNMAVVGAVCTTYILLIGGDLSGPVVGSVFTAFGFAAFGVHFRNYPPILAGVFLAAVLTGLSPTTPSLQVAAVLAVGLAPITGQFGIGAGVLAGALHAALSVSTADLYGGLNLYSSGFNTGWVAIVVVPVIESFRKRYSRKGN